MKKYLGCIVILLLGWATQAYALTFTLPTNGDNVVGKVQWTRSLPGDTFSSVGRRYDIGYYEMVEANPGIDPKLPHPGTLLVIPGRFIIPDAPHKGIVVNLAELRTYYFIPGTRKVVTYPVGVGREGWDTPLGVTSVVAKVKDPVWVPPPDIRKWEEQLLGVVLPDKVLPGPNNPLGSYALYLGFPAYRMHGTNDPSGIGRRSSSGCIRMWPEDVEELFALVPKGAPVLVMNDPYKVGKLNGKLYLESHTPFQEQQAIYNKDVAPMVVDVQVFTTNRPATIDWDTAKQVALQQNGIPQVIGEMK